MEDCLESVNNCFKFFTSCKSKDTNQDTNQDASIPLQSQNSSRNMSTFYTLQLPTRPKVNDEIRIKAKLKQHPKEFIINLGVDSAIDTDEDEPAMIAFHFRTKFKHHQDDKSYVVINCKRGASGWEEFEEIENTWIDDNVDEIDIAIKFGKRDIQFLSGGSNEYQFDHRFEIHRIDRLQIGGDVEFIEEVALRYKN